jgi:hypothetical protein
MSPEQLFSIANAVAVVSWVLLAILPGRRWVTEMLASRVVPAVFAGLYTGLIVSLVGRVEGGFSTLAGVALLFKDPWLLLAGWVHYLAFDLLIGTWEVRDAKERGIPRILVVPCLFLTFMFGPAGWLSYMALRAAVPGEPPIPNPLPAGSPGREIAVQVEPPTSRHRPVRRTCPAV